MININRDSGQSLERRKKVPKGLALLIVLATMLCLSIIAGAILILARGHYYATGVQIKHTKAFYLAEAGIQGALWELRRGMYSFPPGPLYNWYTLTEDGVPIRVDIWYRPATNDYEVKATVDTVNVPTK